MELDGAQRCFRFLKDSGLQIPIFITDRHKGIAKWVRTSEKKTQHFNDIWHVCKGLSKKIVKAAKEKGCEILLYWVKGIRNHLYWSAMSTKMGYGNLILAKWKSIIRHLTNKHEKHPDERFQNCAHGELQDRLWLQVGMCDKIINIFYTPISIPCGRKSCQCFLFFWKVGTKAHQRLSSILLKKTTLKDVAKLSTEAQTSCREGFHSTLNGWHPKMTHFSWLGTFCRLPILLKITVPLVSNTAVLGMSGKCSLQITALL